MFKKIRAKMAGILIVCITILCNSIIVKGEDSSMLLMHIYSSKAYLNGKEIALDETNPTIVPVIRNNRTLIPLKFFAGIMGAEVTWDSGSKSILIKNGEKTINLHTGNTEFTINNVKGQFDLAPQIINGRTFVELKSVAENLFDKKVFYNSNLIAVADTQEELLPLNQYDNFIEKKKLFYSKNLSLNRVEDYDKDGNKVIGFINEWGKFIIPQIYKTVGDFQDGICYAIDPETQKYIFINENNEKLVPKYSYDYPQFSDGLLEVKVDGLYGYMDKKGDLVIEPQFTSVGWFLDGYANVCKDNKRLLINKKGEVLVDLTDKYKDIDYSGYCGNNIDLIEYNNKYGYMNKFGEIIIPPQFDGAEADFKEGVALVWQGNEFNRKYGYIDTNGKLITDFKYRYAQGFSEGLAEVVDPINDDCYIDKTGNIVLNGKFVTAEKFSEGLAAVGFESNSKEAYHYSGGVLYGYINKLGETVVQPQFIRAKEFSGGLAEVWTTKTIGYINTSGEYVWKRNLTELEKESLSPSYEPW